MIDIAKMGTILGIAAMQLESITEQARSGNAQAQDHTNRIIDQTGVNPQTLRHEVDKLFESLKSANQKGCRVSLKLHPVVEVDNE